MAEKEASQESRDLVGTTVHYNGTVSTTAIAIPTVADKVISEVAIYNPSTNSRLDFLYISFDGGTTFREIPWVSDRAWSLKGNKRQVHIKANYASVAYQMLMNFEDF